MATTIDYSKLQASKSRQIQADGGVILVNLPTRTMPKLRVAAGPARTSGAEATTAPCWVGLGTTSDTSLPAYGSANNISRRYLDADRTFEMTYNRLTSDRPTRLIIETTNADDIVEVVLDALDG